MLSAHRFVAALIVLSLAAPEWAAAQVLPWPRMLPAARADAAQPADPTAGIRAYVERIPAGSRVRLTLEDGTRMKGVLMVIEGDDLLVRERKRRPEPPRRIPLARIAEIELEQSGSTLGKGIAIGAAVGAGAALAVIAFLAALFAD